jgi:hypothetical protein
MKLNTFTSTYEIAKFLADQGIKGVPVDTYRCPVARYMRKLYPSATSIQAGPFAIEVCMTEGLSFNLPITMHVAQFMNRFDLGYYPHLISERNDPDQR